MRRLGKGTQPLPPLLYRAFPGAHDFPALPWLQSCGVFWLLDSLQLSYGTRDLIVRAPSKVENLKHQGVIRRDLRTEKSGD